MNQEKILTLSSPPAGGDRGIRAVHNFNAGPSILPTEVFDEASRAILNFNDTGLSILEIGHRTKLFEDVINEAISLLKELMQLDRSHEVLFYMAALPLNFSRYL